MLRWADVVNACRATAPAPAPEPPAQELEMQPIAVANPRAAANQQPFGYLDTAARKVWSCWGFKISWDGGSGDSPLVGWDTLSVGNEGQTRRVCVYGAQGAEYTGTAHG